MVQTRVGISGWRYEGWRGSFYPKDLPAARELDYASHRFNSIELNGSFYSLKKPEHYAAWYEQTPKDFVFAVKGSRFITHNKKLSDPETPLANFFASGVLRLRDKTGPFLWQLPASARFDAKRVEEFFAVLPRDTHQAARLAGRHDARLDGRSWTHADGKRRLRHALEVRHESFFDADLVRLARRYGIALVFSDAADWPYTEELTAGFVYLRLHGAEQTYRSRYGARALGRWAERIRLWRRGRQPKDAARITDRKPPWRKGRDVYVYFDNDEKVHAPRDAAELARSVGAHPAPPG